MDQATLIAKFLFFASLAGLLGAAAMTVTMWAISSTRWARTNMIVAVGSLLTKSRDNAFLVGLFLHGISAVVFGIVYGLLLLAVGLANWPAALFAGGGLGVFHGLVVSLSLCWLVAEQHPVEEFRHVSIAVAFTHFVGHVVYGAVVGLVVALVPL
ncbi:MAG: hypothetical protein QM715_01525 [Nibricoccus sp.]